MGKRAAFGSGRSPKGFWSSWGREDVWGEGGNRGGRALQAELRGVPGPKPRDGLLGRRGRKTWTS